MALVGEATEATFEQEVERSSVPVLVSFWAPWCKPCKVVAPALNQIALAYAGRARVMRVNTDENEALAVRFGIRGLPTVVVFSNGGIVGSAMGVRPVQEYARFVDRALAADRDAAREPLPSLPVSVTDIG